MSTTLKALIGTLRNEALGISKSHFERGRGEESALRAHPDMTAVLAALADDREDTYPERDALSRALLEQHHRSGESAWASALVVAYYPMLSRLRFRLVSDTVPRDELDQVVLTGFLSALNDLPGGKLDRIAMRLRQRTERQVFAFLRKEREHRRPAAERDEQTLCGTECLRQRRNADANEERFELSLLLERGAEYGLTESSLEVLEATVLGRELLRTYVERTGPDDEAERERTYQRLKRQRSRALKKLRLLLSASPASLASGF